MADVDSLHDANSDGEVDTSAIDGDVEDDDTIATITSDASRKKNKRKKKDRGTRDYGKSSGDSDGREPTVEEEDESAACGDEDTTMQNGERHETANGNATSAIPEGSDESVSSGRIAQLQRAMQMFGFSQGAQASAAPKSMEEAQRKNYQFWDTQPVPKLAERVGHTTNEPIEPDKTLDELRHDPYTLPVGFVWSTVDLNNPLQLKELYTLLNENYVEDDDNMFRFDYSPEFLQWALQPPGWRRDWHCGVRVEKTGKLIGFISGVPATIKIYAKTQQMVEINFLCVHKKLRSKRVAPVLIKEITRRVNCTGIFQAVYTAGVVLPKPIATCRYWHRSLNPRKLIEVKFSHLSRNMTMQRTLKLYRLPETPRLPGFRQLTPVDVAETHRLVSQYLTRYNLAPVFTEAEFRHWFLPRTGIVDSYVIESNGEITDFVSFYTLPSTVMHHPTYKSLKAAYSFYTAANRTSWVDLMNDALIAAKSQGFDVFNALDLMENKQFLEKLKFGIGDGNLQYYLFNWRCPAMPPNKVGLVLQ